MRQIARPILLVLVLLAALRISQATLAGPPDDDPFAASNAATAAKPGSSVPASDRTSDLLHLDASVEPKEAHPGQVVRLTIRGTLKPGYHTYPLTQYSEDPVQSAGSLNQLVFERSPALRPLAPVTESDPEFVADKAGGVLLEYTKSFTWSQDVLVAADATPGDVPLSFVVKLQVCDENRCTPGERHFSLPLRIVGPAVAIDADIEKRLAEPAPAPRAVAVPPALRDRMSKPGAGIPDASASGNPSIVVERTPAKPPRVALIPQLGVAVFQGFIMLFTPCVFPMIPITVTIFLKQGEKEHHNPLALATVYSGTIFFVLTLAVLVLGKFIVDWANNVWLNLGMGLLLLFFAMSLFGMFDIELPRFLTRYTSAREDESSYVGVFFMALTFTINSFTCTGPFLGPLLSGVKELQLSIPQLAANAAAYSFGFAGPFFVLALFPRLLKALPKSGGWLNSTKVVMGFVEVALALKFLAITDAGLHPGNPRFFNYETVLCIWMALSVACGLYLLGIFRLPHDSPVQSIGVIRLMLATIFLGLAVYMAPLWGRHTPQGSLGEFLFAWLPQDSAPAFAPGSSPGDERPGTRLAWLSDYEAAWNRAKKEGKLLFIDFTGVNCQNCRYNEGNVFPRADVQNEFAKFVLARLYTDQVPDPALDEAESRKEALRNRGWQEATFGDISLPLYVVLDPTAAPKPLTDDGKLGGIVKGQASGTISNVADFVSVLRNASGKQVALSR